MAPSCSLAKSTLSWSGKPEGTMTRGLRSSPSVSTATSDSSQASSSAADFFQVRGDAAHGPEKVLQEADLGLAPAPAVLSLLCSDPGRLDRVPQEILVVPGGSLSPEPRMRYLANFSNLLSSSGDSCSIAFSTSSRVAYWVFSSFFFLFTALLVNARSDGPSEKRPQIIRGDMFVSISRR